MSRDTRYIALINSTRWRRVRGLKLSADPLCERCKEQGKITPATEVHHIVPLESIKDDAAQVRMAYAISNLMSVCHDCHRDIHLAMHKGTKEERKRRAADEVKTFINRWLGATPGVDF